MGNEALSLAHSFVDEGRPVTSVRAAGKGGAPAPAPAPEAPKPQERTFADTKAGAVLIKLGLVDKDGKLHNNPSYIRAEEYNEKGEVTFSVVYRITSVSAYDVDMQYVEGGVVIPTGRTGTNNSFWEDCSITRSTHAEWAKGK